MDKRLVVVLCVAVAGSTAAITHNLSKTDLGCETAISEATVEDSVCAAWIDMHGPTGDHVVIGPLSDMNGEHIVGS